MVVSSTVFGATAENARSHMEDLVRGIVVNNLSED